jgi:NADH:ubiquinone oxidoreductase subunit H
LVTAYRLMLVVVETVLLGGSGGILSFASMRALFIKRFGFVRPCPFQLRFKQPAAAKFFRLLRGICGRARVDQQPRSGFVPHQAPYPPAAALGGTTLATG